jgi:hypothetical protein
MRERALAELAALIEERLAPLFARLDAAAAAACAAGQATGNGDPQQPEEPTQDSAADREPGRRGPVDRRLRAAYRRVARACHPDRGADPADVERRTRFRTRVNAARDAGDLAELTRLDQEWRDVQTSDPTPPPTEVPASDGLEEADPMALLRAEAARLRALLGELEATEWATALAGADWSAQTLVQQMEATLTARLAASEG